MANFPSSLSTDSNLYVAVNGIQTTLAASILATDTTIQLTSTSGFPATGYVTIDNSEVVSYTGISGPNLTGCTRGADGTTAAPHTLGVTVGATIVAAHHNLLKNEVIAIETALGTGYTQSVTATPSSIMERDANSNTQINNLVENFSTTVTSGGTTTLTVSSSPVQQFTGTTTQTVTLPDATTLIIGFQFNILNRSTGIVSVNNHGGSLQKAIATTGQTVFTVTDISSANGVWDVSTTGTTGTVTNVSGTANQITSTNPTTTPVLAIANPLTLPGPMTAGGAIAMASNKITGLANGTAATDAITFGQVNNIAAPANILDNAGFEIWQRGTSFNSFPSGTHNYSADRWSAGVGSGTDPTLTITRESSTVDSGQYSMKVAVTTVTVFNNIGQILEDFTSYRGQTLTFSIRVNSNKTDLFASISDGVGSTSGTVLGSSGSFQTLSVTRTINAAATTVTVLVQGWTSGETAYLDSAVLVVGSTPMSFIPTNPQVDLARCRRYWTQSYAIGTAAGTATSTNEIRITTPSYNGTNSFWSSFSFPVTMRVSPTVTIYNPATGASGSISGQTSSGGAVTPSVSADQVSNNYFNFATAGTTTAIQAVFHYTASADL